MRPTRTALAFTRGSFTLRRCLLLGACVLAACGDSGCNEGRNRALPALPATPVAAVASPPRTQGAGGTPRVAPAATPEAAARPPDAASARDAQCASICSRSVALGCQAAQRCAALCRQSLNVATCIPQMQAVAECLLAQPLARWECTEHGVAAIKDGFCDREQRVFVACAAAHAE